MFYLVISVSAYSHCLIYLHVCMHACARARTHTHTHTPHKTSPTKETKYLTSARLGVAMTTECKKYIFFLILKWHLVCLPQSTLKNKTQYNNLLLKIELYKKIKFYSKPLCFILPSILYHFYLKKSSTNRNKL